MLMSALAPPSDGNRISLSVMMTWYGSSPACSAIPVYSLILRLLISDMANCCCAFPLILTLLPSKVTDCTSCRLMTLLSPVLRFTYSPVSCARTVPHISSRSEKIR